MAITDRSYEHPYTRVQRNSALGGAAVAAGAPDYVHNDMQTNVVDMLANVLHYCRAEDLDFDAAVARARGHFADEVAEAAASIPVDEEDFLKGVRPSVDIPF